MLNKEQRILIENTAKFRIIPLLIVWGFCFFLIPMMITSLGIVIAEYLLFFLTMFLCIVSMHHIDKFLFKNMFKKLEELEETE